MSHFRIAPLSLLIGSMLVLSSCDTGTDPALRGLDPDAVVAAVHALVQPIESSGEAIANTLAAFEDLEDHGVQFSVSERPGAAALARLGLPIDAPLPAQFPTELRGRTLVYDAASGGWEVDEARTGAPSDGVRLIWYELDGSDQPVVPLVEKGHVDLSPGDDPDLETLELVVVDASAGGTTVLDFVQGYSETTGTEWSTYLEGAGFYTDGTRRVDFTIESSESGSDATNDAEYAFIVTLEDADTRYSFHSEGMVTGSTGVYEDRVEAVVERGGATTALAVTFEGVGQTQQGGEGTLRHDTKLVADVTISGSFFSFERPDGTPFPGSQTTQLNILFQTLMLNALVPIFELPLIT